MASTYLVLQRPRRFGKSLFYVDAQVLLRQSSNGNFEKNFRDTFVGSHRSELQGLLCHYKVMISSDTTDNRRTFDENRIAQFESDAIPQYRTVIRAIDMASLGVASLGVADIKALQTEVGLHSRLQLSEAPIQFFMLGAVELLKGFKATAEEEALGIGFSDVVIRPTTESDFRQAYLVELQYLTQAAGTPAAVEAKLDDAGRQSAAYASAENVRTFPNLKKLAVVFAGPTVNGVRYL